MADYDTDYDDQDEGQKADRPIPEGLEAAVAAEVTDGISFVEEAYSDKQAEMTEFYKGELPGITEEDAQDNRSDIVSRDVHDAVQAAMPDLIRTFLGADHVVEFRPGGPDDEAHAQQATDAIRYIFEKENDAFLFIHGALKDGLVRKYALATWWHEEEDKSFERDYSGLSLDALAAMLDDGQVEVVDTEEVTDLTTDPATGAQVPVTTINAKLLHVRKEHCFRVELVPPEELVVSRKARNAKGDRFIGRRQNKTVDELVAMGYDEDEVEEYAGSGADAQLTTNELAYERNPEGQNFGPNRGDDGAKEVLYVEGYMRWMVDGRYQLIKVCCLGDAHNIVRWSPVDDIPMALWTPDPEPHTVVGESWAEKVADIQRLKTGTWRGIMDSLAEALVPRTEVVEGQVNIDDAMSNEIGQLVRVRAPGMVRTLSTPFVGQQAFPLIELADNMREERVGSFRAADGLSAETMQSSTRMAVAATISGSKAQKELLARGFAEMFLKPVFRGLLRLFVENQDRAKWMRLRGQWAEVDPRGWNAGMDAEVNVALSMSTAEERLQVLGAIAEKQEMLLQTLGPVNPVTSLAQYAGTLRKMVELAGYKNADWAFNRVDPNWQPPQQEQQPDPALVLANAQVEALKAEMVRKDKEALAKAQLDRARLDKDDDFRRDELAQQKYLKLAELEGKFSTDVVTTNAQIDAEVNMNRDQAAMAAAAQSFQPPAPPVEGVPPQ